MAGDPHFSKVALLLSGDSFTDASYNHSVVTHQGVTVTDDVLGPFAKSFYYSLGLSGQPLAVAAPVNSAIGEGIDLTIELTAFCYKNPVGSALFSTRSADGSGILIGLDSDLDPFVRVSFGGELKLQINTKLRLRPNSLHSFCLQRKAGVWTLYMDGIPFTDSEHSNIYAGEVGHGEKIFVGCDLHTAPFLGSISQVRFTVGLARHTGYYAIEPVPFPTFSTDISIGFGPLSRNLSQTGQVFTASLIITNAYDASVIAVDGSNLQTVGNGWKITRNPNGVPNSWVITGNSPLALSRYRLVVTAQEYSERGGQSASQVYSITNTAQGLLDAEQQLFENLGSLTLWLDGSDQTTLSVDASSRINAIVDKANSVVFSPLPGKPVPTVSSDAFENPSIQFTNTTANGFLSSSPITLTDGNSNSTVFLVGRYTGQQMGQGGGLFQLSYYPTANIIDGTATWGIYSETVGSTNAKAYLYDNNSEQDGAVSPEVLASGEKFLLVWKSTTGKVEIFVDQKLVVVVPTIGHISNWKSIDSAISFIGGAQSPNGPFITLGEVIGFNANLDENTTSQIESYLNHKWNLYTPVPYAKPPSTLVGYAGNDYYAVTQLVDATDATISVSGGSDWTLTRLNGENWAITGKLPAIVGVLDLTITTYNGSISNDDTFKLVVEAIPNKPVIETPLSLACQVDSGYVSLLTILNADTVSVSASAGSDWKIEPASVGVNRYVITGNMPSEVGSLNLLVVAQLHLQDASVVEVTGSFTILATPTQITQLFEYPLDLSGMLPSNLVERERQTLTSSSGANHQLIAPLSGPFFGESMVVKYYGSDTNLRTAVAGVDYEFVFANQGLSKTCQTAVWSGIRFLNRGIYGLIELTYQTVGGVHSLNRKALLEFLVNFQENTKTVSWTAVTGRPNFYPVASHKLHIQKNSLGYIDLKEAVDNLAAVGIVPEVNPDFTALSAHVLQTHNPHHVTPAQLGLGLVHNYPTATASMAVAGTSLQSYLTPRTTMLSSNNAVGIASTQTYGRAKLNLGLYQGDDVDVTKALTAKALQQMLESSGANAFKDLLSVDMVAVKVTDRPFLFPVTWNGSSYQTFEDLMAAVSDVVGVFPIPFNKDTNEMWFPSDVTLPDLTMYPRTPT